MTEPKAAAAAFTAQPPGLQERYNFLLASTHHLTHGPVAEQRRLTRFMPQQPHRHLVRREQGVHDSRNKFRSIYLFDEFHWDTGEPDGTAKPYALLPHFAPADDRLAFLNQLIAEHDFDASLKEMVLTEGKIADQR